MGFSNATTGTVAQERSVNRECTGRTGVEEHFRRWVVAGTLCTASALLLVGCASTAQPVTTAGANVDATVSAAVQATVTALGRVPTSTLPASDIPDGWRVYRSVKYPFSIAYPPQWTVSQATEALGIVRPDTFTLDLEDAPGTKRPYLVELRIRAETLPPRLGLDQYVANKLGAFETPPRSEQLAIGGLQGRLVIPPYLPDKVGGYEVGSGKVRTKIGTVGQAYAVIAGQAFEFEMRLYSVQVPYRDVGDTVPTLDRYRQVLQEMLGTVRFVE